MESTRCRAFVRAAEEGSFTAAGRLLDYTPSGVSQLVRALEQELGMSLLTRKNRGVALTREGERIYPQIVEFVRKEDSILDLAKEVNELQRGKITIATFTSIATHILPGVIRGFCQQHCKIDIEIIEASKSIIEEMLSENRADLAFVSKIDNPSYSWLPFMEDRIIAVLPLDHKYAGAKAYPVSECIHDDLIMPDSGRDMDVITMLRSNGIEPKIRFSTTENYTAINMAGKGLGINIVNEFITKSWESDCAILPLDPPASVEFGIELPSLDGASPAVRSFVSYSLKKIRDEIY